MPNRNEHDYVCRLDGNGRCRLGLTNFRFFGIGVILTAMAFSTGCSPGLLVTSAIVVPSLYAHLNQARREQARTTADQPLKSTSYPGVNRVTDTSSNRVSNAPSVGVPQSSPTQMTKSPSNKQPAGICSVPEGTKAYRELRWADAARILTKSVSTETCTAAELNEAHILLGAMEYQQGNPQAAKLHLVAAYRHDRRRRLSSDLFPPQLVEFYKAVNGIKDP